MPMTFDRIGGVALLTLCLGVGAPALGQPGRATPFADDLPTFQQAQQMFKTGSFAAAAELFQRADGLDADDGVIGASRAYALIGEYDRAIEVVEQALGNDDPADRPEVATQLAEVLRTVGRSAEALTVLQQIVSEHPEPPVRALVQYGSLLKFVGRRAEATSTLLQAVQRYDDGLVFAADDVAMVAVAQWQLDRFHEANSLFSEALRADPENLEANTLWGDLFQEKYNAAEAAQSYEEVLDINSRYVPALVGLTRVQGNPQSLQRAMAINPRYVPGIETYALQLQRNNRLDEARDAFNQALEVNPEALNVLSALAADAAMHERMDDYARYKARVDAFSPNNPVFLANVADVFGNNYRFTEAVAYAREAIEVDPGYWQAYTLLGMNLVRLGEEEEGKRNLEIGFDNDPFNVMTSNTLKVFDTLAEYVTFETPHFRVQMSRKDSDILWPYFQPLIEEAWDTLTAKYGFEPESPVLIQVFEKTEDFAVRSVGLPDIGPLVGICFGKVITLISPDTLTANWQEIVWHEFMHVITLQMTQNRMPRWLSEGISVWEESEGRPYWGRRQGLDLVRAVQQDKLLHVARLNEGFSGAQTNADLGFAYFQSYLVVDYITEQHGFEKLVELVKQYGLIKEEDQMFQDVFGESVDDFDRGFRDWATRRVEDINIFVHSEDMPDDGEGHGHGIRENSSAILAELYNNASLRQHMQQRIENEPRDFQAHLQLGIVLFKEGDYPEARRHLEIAQEMLPDYAGYPSPALVLAQIYEREGNREAQLEQLRVVLQTQQHDFESAMILAADAIEKGDGEGAGYYLDRALQVDPYRIDVHRLKARYAELIQDPQMAVTEYEVLLELDLNDPVDARTNLASAYLRNGQVDEARSQVLNALETAPSYRPAQQILLQAVDARP